MPEKSDSTKEESADERTTEGDRRPLDCSALWQSYCYVEAHLKDLSKVVLDSNHSAAMQFAIQTEGILQEYGFKPFRRSAESSPNDEMTSPRPTPVLPTRRWLDCCEFAPGEFTFYSGNDMDGHDLEHGPVTPPEPGQHPEWSEALNAWEWVKPNA